MASIPPIPGLPSSPYTLPFNLSVDPSHILKFNDPSKDFDPNLVSSFLDCLVCEPVGREGCNWIIQLNRKVYLMVWRDVAPHSPWTRQVWDIYWLRPDVCGCPSAPIGLGWQWCWPDVIKTLRFHIFNRWQAGDLSGSGQTVVATGTNAFQSATVGIKQIGPVLYLDASDSATLTLSAGGVERWGDKSTFENHALQTVALNRPTVDPGSLNGLDTVRFDAGLSQFLDVPLKARADWHLFVVGRFLTNLANPRGTFFSASGFEGSFGGIEGKIYQDGSLQPEGTPFTFVNSNDVYPAGLSLSASQYGILEYSQTLSAEGETHLGLDAFYTPVFTGNTSDDFWDPTRQTFGQAVPLRASLGRSNWGVNPLRSFDYLDGNIGQLLLYPRVLSQGERVQVLNVLRSKWGLGAPLSFPP
jgi:hypothetical protein